MERIWSKIFLGLILLSTAACSNFRESWSNWFGKPPADDQELVGLVEPKWFTQNPNFSLKTSDGSVASHLFFDAAPEINPSQKHVAFFPLTLEGADEALDFDLVSGQRYFSHYYCSQKDIWKQYSGSISHPPFTVGIIPRYLDQLGWPQRIIVFGDAEKFNVKSPVTYRVRLVGSYVEQVCLHGTCQERDSWLSHMILVAVDPATEKYKDIHNIKELVKAVDWKKVKAFVENGDGRNKLGENYFPAVKMGGVIDREEGMNYLLKRSVVITNTEAKKIFASCTKLWDLAWKDVGERTIFDMPATTTQQVKERVRIKAELKARRRPVDFHERVAEFIRSYGDDAYTCSKFVYPGNINENPERLWFMTYFNMFIKLHREGWFYDCDRRAWENNSRKADGKLAYDIKVGIGSCSTKELDHAFSMLPSLMSKLSHEPGQYYRFIDYDQHSFGTHAKMYSWVRLRNRSFDCSGNQNSMIKEKWPIVPKDMSWIPRFNLDKDSDMGIIY